MKKFLLSLTLSFLIFSPAMAISETQEKNIISNCSEIREKLRDVQKSDSRSRVYLGQYYEIISKNFVTPFNVRLVENNLSTPDLVENQNLMADARELFTSDFIEYQKKLEELILTDCKAEPKVFYEKLEVVRQKRKIMEQDVLKMYGLASGHLKLAEELKGKL